MRSVFPNHTRPIWAEISVAALRANFHALQAAAGPELDVLAVVKADAYGHGAAECAPLLAAAGARWLGVTSVEEGVAVRGALEASPHLSPRVLVMCGLWAGEAAAALAHALTPVVWEGYHLDLIEEAARGVGAAARSVAVHVEIDTGMTRQGVGVGAALDALLGRFTEESPLLLEGVMTHLASTEVADDPGNARQMRAFGAALAQVSAAGFRPALVHVGNTSSTDSGLAPQMLPGLAGSIGAAAMTRAGLALYGYALPLEHGAPQLVESLRPAMTWKTRVVSLRDVAAGTAVGYNGTFVATDAMRLALLPVGYADGFRRGLSSSSDVRGGDVLLHGQRAAIVGRVSMDLTVVDVTSINGVVVGDEVVLIGASGDAFVGADELARVAGTSVYEVLCGISERVPRVVVD